LLSIFIVLLKFRAITHTSTASSEVATIEELQLLPDLKQLCRLAFYEKETAPHSDLITAVASVEPSTISVRGVKVTRSVAGLDLLSALPGDLRETDKRRCNPHVLPFHHFSFGRLTVIRANCRAYGFY